MDRLALALFSEKRIWTFVIVSLHLLRKGRSLARLEMKIADEDECSTTDIPHSYSLLHDLLFPYIWALC